MVRNKANYLVDKTRCQNYTWVSRILVVNILLVFVTACQSVRNDQVPLTIDLPEENPLTIRNSPILALSPDGNYLTYAADILDGEERQLMLMPLSGKEPYLLEGTQGAETPFFSPDSQWIGFFANNQLKKISFSNNLVEVISDAPEPKGGFWAKDDTIVYSTGSIWRVSQNGGTPTRITLAVDGELQFWPVLAGDNNTLFYNSISQHSPTPEIVIHNIASGRNSTIITNGNYPKFLRNGQLLFVENAILKSVEIDLESQIAVSEPESVLENILISPNTGAGQYGISETGSLVYVEGRIFGSSRQVVYLDEMGNETDPGYPLARNSYVRFSEDAEHLAIESEPDVLVYDVESKQLVYQIENASYPVWGPGKKDITFTWVRPGQNGLYTINIESGIRTGPLVFSNYPVSHSYAWSKDGMKLAFTETHPESGMDIWLRPDSGPPRALLNDNIHECCAVFSPDGNWLTYVSGETGRPEVYVTSYPSFSNTKKLSPNGGREPMWSPDGNALYYWENRKFQKVMFNNVSIGQFSLPETITEGIFVSSTSTWRPRYDIHPDGNKFVIIKRGPEEMGITRIRLIPAPPNPL